MVVGDTGKTVAPDKKHKTAGKLNRTDQTTPAVLGLDSVGFVLCQDKSSMSYLE